MKSAIRSWAIQRQLIVFWVLLTGWQNMLIILFQSSLSEGMKHYYCHKIWQHLRLFKILKPLGHCQIICILLSSTYTLQHLTAPRLFKTWTRGSKLMLLFSSLISSYTNYVLSSLQRPHRHSDHTGHQHRCLDSRASWLRRYAILVADLTLEGRCFVTANLAVPITAVLDANLLPWVALAGSLTRDESKVAYKVNNMDE